MLTQLSRDTQPLGRFHSIWADSANMPPLAKLTSLTPREAVTDVVLCMLHGLDRNDLDVFSAAFTGEDAVLELNGGGQTLLHSRSAIVERVFNPIGPMDSTHMISNVRVDVKDGADSAFLTCFVLAQHAAPGKGREFDAPKYMVGGDYAIELVKDGADGAWKIKKFVLEVLWNQGDPVVMQKPV
jgi:hypothetical protein